MHENEVNKGRSQRSTEMMDKTNGILESENWGYQRKRHDDRATLEEENARR